MSKIIMLLKITFLITGGLVGAGILALPINTGLAGFFPSITMILLAGGAMLMSAFIIAEESIAERTEKFDLPSIYGRHLGQTGKWIAVAANLVILYGFLVAYLTGATTIIASLINIPVPKPVILILFFLFITLMTIKGIQLVSKYSSALVVLMFGAFAILIWMGSQHVAAENLRYTDWKFAPQTIPIILAAFYFHNVIPQCTAGLKWNRWAIMTAIVLGISISVVMNVAWIRTGIGVLPLTGEGSILEAYTMNQPATAPMAREISSSFFMTNALLFSILAIATSYLGFGSALLAFTTDLTHNHLGWKNHIVDLAIAFVPPFVIALVYPNIFLTTLNIIGGLGVALLFGILPCVIVIRKARSWIKRTAGFLLLLVFAVFMLIELGQETGLLRIAPQIEHWTHYLGNNN